MNSQSLVNCFVWNHQYFEQKKIIGEAPDDMIALCTCIAPSSNCSLLTLNLPFEVILRRFVVVFWCMDSGERMLHFSKDWWQFIQIHQYYILHQNLTLQVSEYNLNL